MDAAAAVHIEDRAYEVGVTQADAVIGAPAWMCFNHLELMAVARRQLVQDRPRGPFRVGYQFVLERVESVPLTEPLRYHCVVEAHKRLRR